MGMSRNYQRVRSQESAVKMPNRKSAARSSFPSPEKPMKRVRNYVAVVACLLMVSSLAAQDKPTSAGAAAGKRGRTFIDSLEQPIVGDPQLSPDGKTIL